MNLIRTGSLIQIAKISSIGGFDLMYIFLSVCVVCATFIWFSVHYLQPYTPPKDDSKETFEVDEDGNVVSMDNVLAEIYDYLDNDKKEGGLD